MQRIFGLLYHALQMNFEQKTKEKFYSIYIDKNVCVDMCSFFFFLPFFIGARQIQQIKSMKFIHKESKFEKKKLLKAVNESLRSVT